MNDITLRVTAKDDASRVLDGVGSKAKGLGSTFASVGKIAGGFLAANVIAAGAQKVVGFIGESISAASDLEQSIGGVNSVFGDSAQSIFDWGQTAAKAAGLSKQQFNSLAAPLGAMLKNAGVENFSQEVIKLTQLGADLAATFGGSVEEAMTAVTAAFRGETDPIERYGVSMNAARVEAEALAMTGKKLASELTDQEKAMARLSLITQQTADAQGQFARETDTAAGKAAISAAKWENLQATLGEKMLPIQVKLTEAKIKLADVLATKVIPYLEALYAKHWPAVAKVIQDVVAVVEEWWPKLQPILEMVATHVKTQIEGMIQAWQGIIQIVTGVVGTIKAVFEGDWAAAWENMKLIAEGALNLLVGTIKRIFGSLATELYDIGKTIIQGLIDGITSKLGEVENLFKSITDKIPKLKGPESKDKTLLEQAGELIMAGLAAGLEDGFGSKVEPLLKSIADRVMAAVNAIISQAQSAAGGAVGGGGRTWDYFVQGGKAFAKIFSTGQVIPLPSGMAEDAALRYLQNMGYPVRHSGGMIHQTGPYFLQKGEQVVSASDVAQGGNGGFAFNVTTMNIYEKDDREVKDVAFAVTATMDNEVRRRGYLLSSSSPTTSTGVRYARP